MGIFDNFFSDSQESEQITKKLFDPQARGFLKGLLGPAPEFPVRPVPGLTPAEIEGQNQLARFVRGDTFRDPTTSPFFEGFRRESAVAEEKAVSGLRRRSQLGGALFGGPSFRAEGELRRDFANRRMSELGRLFEIESARDNPLTRTAASVQFGALPRLVEAAQGGAEFDAELMEILFPFSTQAQIAQILLDIGQKSKGTTTSTPSSFSQLSSIAGLAGGAIGALGPAPNLAGTTTAGLKGGTKSSYSAWLN